MSVRVASVAVACVCAATARAQGVDATPPGRIDVSVGIAWAGPADFGNRNASEGTSTAGTFTLFGTASELAGAATLEAAVGVHVWRALELEGAGSYSKPQLRTRIDADAEASNAPLTVSAPVDQFTVGGAGLWYFRRRGRLYPFARAGMAYLRQLENGGALVADGTTLDLGGGVKWVAVARRRKRVDAFGARVEARAFVRRDGVTLDGGAHVSPAVGVSMFLRF